MSPDGLPTVGLVMAVRPNEQQACFHNVRKLPTGGAEWHSLALRLAMESTVNGCTVCTVLGFLNGVKSLVCGA